MAFPVEHLRREFPALAQAGDFLFFDNAAGAQVPASVLAAVTDHLVSRNVQRGGPYDRSQEVDAMIARAREAVAAFVNARVARRDRVRAERRPRSSGSISLAVGQTLDSRPEIVVSDLDHEANIATWVALERVGARIVLVEGARRRAAARRRPRARWRRTARGWSRAPMASNATGTRVDVAAAARRSRTPPAPRSSSTPVHFGPHGPIDVQALDCDYLVCSGYKIFAPHMGFAWCRAEAINRLPTFREDFIPDVTPDKLEAGTYVYENVAGMEAVVLLSRSASAGGWVRRKAHRERCALRAAMEAIAAHERTLSGALLDAVSSIDGASVHGVTDRSRLDDRVPTVAFSVKGMSVDGNRDGAREARHRRAQRPHVRRRA